MHIVTTADNFFLPKNLDREHSKHKFAFIQRGWTKNSTPITDKSPKRKLKIN